MVLLEGTTEKIPSDTTGDRSRDRPTSKGLLLIRQNKSVETDMHVVCTAIVTQLLDIETTVITITIHIPFFTAVQLVLKTYQALLIHCSAKNFITLLHVLIITAVCVGIYTAGRD